MATTTIPNPLMMGFELDISKTFVSTRHYRHVKGKDLFSEKLNISKDRMCAKSSPTYWLKTWNGKKWSNWITGLFPTHYEGWFYGDTDRKKNQVIFHFEGAKLELFYFEKFYTSRVNELVKLLQSEYKKKRVVRL